MNQYYFKLLWLILFVISSVGHSVEELSKIQVTTDKEVTLYFFGSSQLLDSDNLQTQTIPLLGPSLDKMPGLIAVQNGGIGGRTSFFIRGTESRHVAFTLDNLKLNDPSNTDRQFDAAFLSLPSIYQIKLHQGPQAVIFGSDAMGGHIEMITRKGEAAPETRLSLHAGSFGTLGSSLSHDWQNKSHQGTLSLFRMRSDGISRLNEKRFNAQERDGASVTQLTSSSRHQWKSKISTDFLVSYLNGSNELDGNTSDNSLDRSSNDQYLLQQKSTMVSSKKLSFSLRNGLSRHQRFLKTQAAGKSSFSGDLLQNEAILKYQQQNLSWLTGLAHEHEAASFGGFNPDFDLFSLFTQGLYRFEKLAGQGGLRMEQHTRYGNFVTGATGLQFFLEQFTISLQYSRGYKAPSLYQLYAPAVFGTPIGNDNLVPETNQAYEAKIEQKSQRFEWGMTMFQNRLSNLITFSNSGYLNQGRFTSRGLEAGVKLIENNFHLSFSGTHQDFTEEKTPVLRRPYNHAQIALSWFASETQEIFTKFKWFDHRKDIDQNLEVVKLNAFETVDVGIRQSWGQHDLSLQLLNLLDRDFEEFYGFSVTPRSLYSSYSFRFN